MASKISRLVIDCNRPLDAPDLIAEVSETTRIPGNRGLDAEERRRRIAFAYEPFHAAIDELSASGAPVTGWQAGWFPSIPSRRFTGACTRPWEIGIIHDEDERLAEPLIDGLRAIPELTVGVNQPYSPADRVYYTLERHARTRGMPCAMIEIRNDEIEKDDTQRKWAERLGGILRHLVVRAKRRPSDEG